ncbi:hypothetical protein F5Y02DRAFT_431412 [Annulohypoxylon stygium]|nr:hypothetical protein F5Y02DRAFT_431412 [Annulohypoxylon stygium]
MADILGTVASTITVADVALKAAESISKLKRLFTEIQGVPKTIHSLVQQVELLDLFVWDLEQADTTNPILFNDDAIRRSTGFCRKSLIELTRLVDDLSSQVNTQKRLKRCAAKAKIILDKKVLSDFQSHLQRVIMMLSLAQQNYMIALVRLQPYIMLGHQANIREIHRSKIDAMEKEDINMSFVQQKTCIAVDIGASAGELKEGKCEKTSFIGLPAQSSSRRPLFPWRGNTTLGSISTNFQIVRSTSNIFLESTYGVRIQLPAWLASRAWDIQVAKEISGWKVNLRAWRVAPDSPAMQAIVQGDKQSLIDSLTTGRASIFDRNDSGSTLLHVATDVGNLECFDLLLAAGLDLNEQNERGQTALAYFLARFYSRDLTSHPKCSLWSKAGLAESGFKLLSSYGVFDRLKEDYTALYQVIRYMYFSWYWSIHWKWAGRETDDSNETIRLHNSHIQGPFRIYDTTASLQIIACPYNILAPTLPFISCSWLDNNDSMSEDASEKSIPLWNFLAHFITSQYLRGEEYEWQSIFKELLDAGATNLHTLHELFHECRGLNCPVTPLFWVLWTAYRNILPLRGTFTFSTVTLYCGSVLKFCLRRWLSLLKGCYIDLEEYGRRERAMLLKNPRLSSYRWTFLTRDCGCLNHKSGLISDIRYGANPEDWDIEWSGVELHPDRLSEDSIHTCCLMPGSWPGEDNTDDEEEREARNLHQKRRDRYRGNHPIGISGRRYSF